MRSIEAVDLINDEIDYKPGWGFEAFPADEHGHVWVITTFSACDSLQELAKLGYPNHGRVAQPILLRVDDLADREELWARFFARVILAIETHEAREFYRLRGEDYRAPFHPHRPEGRAAYVTNTHEDGVYDQIDELGFAVDRAVAGGAGIFLVGDVDAQLIGD